MALKEVKILVQDLKPGMFVCRLDRPWLETPYMMQGFYVEGPQVIEEIARYCKYVYIDVILGKSPADHYERLRTSVPDVEVRDTDATPTVHPVYEQTKTLEEELTTAKSAHADLAGLVRKVIDNLRIGKKLYLGEMQKAVSPMIDSVLRNPDAFIWLARLKSKDDYTYNHSLSACVWATVFGRHLGLPRNELEELALGALLFDIGKTRVPSELLTKPERLTPEEFDEIKRHVLYGMDILKQTKGVSANVIAMVLSHHERYNGSGYPRGLKGHEIPVFGRIAAIVDCYDAITSPRPYAATMSPYEAIKKLYEWRDLDFQAELVEQFIQAIGLYPAGTLVEISTGEVGVVIAQNRVRRLRPRIMLLLDADKRPRNHFPVIDLLTETEDKDGRHLEISKGLEPGAYGIDPSQYYL